MDTILTVRPEDFDQIDKEQQAVNFLQELLWAEAVQIGIPLSDINISLLTKVPDGGVDATARKPSNVSQVSSIIPDEYYAWIDDYIDSIERRIGLARVVEEVRISNEIH